VSVVGPAKKKEMVGGRPAVTVTVDVADPKALVAVRV